MFMTEHKLRGHQVDFINGGILSALARFTVPVLLSLVFQQLYNTVDTVIIGHFLGEEALASMGSASAVYDLFLAFITGMSGGISIVAARAWGEGDRSLLRKAVAHSLVIAAATALVITTASLLSLRPFLQVLQTPAEVLEGAFSYVSVITAFYAVTLAYNLCAGLLRAIGNSVMPLVFLIISSLLNVALDWLCIVVLGMGIRGAAVATVIAQLISVLLSVAYIFRRVKVLIPRKEDFAPNSRLSREIITQGLSMGFMSGIVISGTAILQSAINGLGYLIVAGHVAARKLFSLLAMFGFAMMNAVSTFVSQNYGAHRFSRIRRGLKIVYLIDLCIYAVLTVVIWFAAPTLVRLISGSEEQVIIANGTKYLRVVVPCLPILGVLSSTRSSLQAIGQKILPLYSSLIELVSKIAFVFFFIPLWGYDAVVFCEPVIWVLMNVELLLAFWGNREIRLGKDA